MLLRILRTSLVKMTWKCRSKLQWGLLIEWMALLHTTVIRFAPHKIFLIGAVALSISFSQVMQHPNACVCERISVKKECFRFDMSAYIFLNAIWVHDITWIDDLNILRNNIKKIRWRKKQSELQKTDSQGKSYSIFKLFKAYTAPFQYDTSHILTHVLEPT